MLDFDVFLLGGGTRVPAHLGAVKALEQSGARVAAWAGVSGGSLVAALFASGYSSQQAADLMLKTDYRRLLDPSPISLFRRMGLFAGRRIQRWLDHELRGRTFGDLETPLSVLATDVATGQPFIFSPTHTPDIKLSTAVRCSISLPGIFAVPEVAGRGLVDGCFADITPEMLFGKTDRRSLVVRLHESAPVQRSEPANLTRRGYVFHVANLVLRNLKPLSHPELWDEHVRISVGSSPSLQFDLTADEKRELFDRGYQACRDVMVNAILEEARSCPAGGRGFSQEASQLDGACDRENTAVLA